MFTTEILNIFDYITRNKVDYCKICLRTAHERKLIRSQTLRDLILCLNMTFENDLSLCYVCQAKVVSTMNFMMTLKFAKTVNSLYKDIRGDKRLKDKIYTYLKYSEQKPEQGTVFFEASLCENLLSSVQKRTLLKRTNTFVINCAEEQNITKPVVLYDNTVTLAPSENNIPDIVSVENEKNVAPVVQLYPLNNRPNDQIPGPTLTIVNGVIKCLHSGIAQPQTINNNKEFKENCHVMRNSVENTTAVNRTNVRLINDNFNVNENVNNSAVNKNDVRNNINNESNRITVVMTEAEDTDKIKRFSKRINNEQIIDTYSIVDEILKQKINELNARKRLKSDNKTSFSDAISQHVYNLREMVLPQVNYAFKDIILGDEKTDNNIQISFRNAMQHDEITKLATNNRKDAQMVLPSISIKDVFSMVDDQNKNCDDLQVIETDDGGECGKMCSAAKIPVSKSGNIDWEDKIPMDVISFMEPEAPPLSATSKDPRAFEVRSVYSGGSACPRASARGARGRARGLPSLH